MQSDIPPLRSGGGLGRGQLEAQCMNKMQSISRRERLFGLEKPRGVESGLRAKHPAPGIYRSDSHPTRVSPDSNARRRGRRTISVISAPPRRFSLFTVHCSLFSLFTFHGARCTVHRSPRLRDFDARTPAWRVVVAAARIELRNRECRIDDGPERELRIAIAIEQQRPIRAIHGPRVEPRVRVMDAPRRDELERVLVFLEHVKELSIQSRVS